MSKDSLGEKISQEFLDCIPDGYEAIGFRQATYGEIYLTRHSHVSRCDIKETTNGAYVILRKLETVAKMPEDYGKKVKCRNDESKEWRLGYFLVGKDLEPGRSHFPFLVQSKESYLERIKFCVLDEDPC